MIKSLFRSGFFQSLLGSLIAFYMDLIVHTTRYDIEGEEHIRDAWDGEEGFVIACWHSRIAMMPVFNRKLQKRWTRKKQSPGVIVSMSKDGEFVARAAQKLKMIPIRGSAANKSKTKDKGGIAALRQANSLLLEGRPVCVTPDGPRGPREHASLGAVRIAQRAGAPILVCGIAAAPATRLKSWDRFLLPRPFARGKIIIAHPIAAPRDGDAEIIRAELERTLRDVTDRAEQAVGLDLVPRPQQKLSGDAVENAAS